MKKLLALFIALALLLAACATAEPAINEPAETTTAQPIITEPIAEPEPFTPISGEENGFVWRTLDLGTYPELAAQLAREFDWEYRWPALEQQRTELERSWNAYGIYILENGDIVHRHQGQETLLIAFNCEQYGEDGHDCFNCRLPRVLEVLQENYLLVRWEADRHGAVSIFCVRTRRDHPLANANLSAFWWQDGRLLGAPLGWYYGPQDPTMHLFEADLATLPNLEFPVDLLSGMAGEFQSLVPHARLSPNMRHYAVSNRPQLHVFDLQLQRAITIEVPPWCFNDYFVWSDDDTLLWFHECRGICHHNIAVEITLP